MSHAMSDCTDKALRIVFRNALNGQVHGHVKPMQLPYICDCFRLRKILGSLVLYMRIVQTDEKLQGFQVTFSMVNAEANEVILDLVVLNSLKLRNSWRAGASSHRVRKHGWRDPYLEFRHEVHRVLIRNPDTPLSDGYFWANHDVRALSVFVLQWQAEERRQLLRRAEHNSLPNEVCCFDWAIKTIMRVTSRSESEVESFIDSWMDANGNLIVEMQEIIDEHPDMNYFE